MKTYPELAYALLRIANRYAIVSPLTPTLLVWGQNDPFFPETAARAFLTDLPTAELHHYPTGHFALEEYLIEISTAIRAFLASIRD